MFISRKRLEEIEERLERVESASLLFCVATENSEGRAWGKVNAARAINALADHLGVEIKFVPRREEAGMVLEKKPKK